MAYSAASWKNYNKNNNVSCALTICAIASILFPVHPSLQAFFLTHGIHSSTISIILATPIFYTATVKRLYSSRNISIFLSFFAYVTWLLFRATTSPAIARPNYFDSIRSLFVLTPLALLAAFVAGRNTRTATNTIFALGLIAIAHYHYLLFSGAFDETVSFRSLSPHMEKQNYQATSFYFGLVGLAMTMPIIRGRKIAVAIGTAGFLYITALMATVGARSSIVALIVTFFIFAWLSGWARFAQLVFATTVTGSLLILCAGMLGFFDFQELQDKFIALNRFIVLTESDDSSHRIWLFSAAIEMWLESSSNFMFGAGLGTFPQFIGVTEDGWYPHNFVLESLAEGGVVAGVLLFHIGLKFFIKLIALSAKRQNIEQVYLGSIAVYATIAYQFVGGVQTIWIPTFYVALFLFSKPHQIT